MLKYSQFIEFFFDISCVVKHDVNVNRFSNTVGYTFRVFFSALGTVFV